MSVENLFVDALKNYAAYCHAKGQVDLAAICELNYQPYPVTVATVARGILKAIADVSEGDRLEFLISGASAPRDDLSTRRARVAHFATVCGNCYNSMAGHAHQFPDSIVELYIPWFGYAEGMLAAINGNEGIPPRLQQHWGGPVRIGYVQAQLVARGVGTYEEVMDLLTQ